MPCDVANDRRHASPMSMLFSQVMCHEGATEDTLIENYGLVLNIEGKRGVLTRLV